MTCWAAGWIQLFIHVAADMADGDHAAASDTSLVMGNNCSWLCCSNGGSCLIVNVDAQDDGCRVVLCCFLGWVVLCCTQVYFGGGSVALATPEGCWHAAQCDPGAALTDGTTNFLGAAALKLAYSNWDSRGGMQVGNMRRSQWGL